MSVAGGLRTVCSTCFIEDAGNVVGHGLGADEKLVGYLLVRLADGYETQHLHLARGQAVWIAGRTSPGAPNRLFQGNHFFHEGGHAKFENDCRRIVQKREGLLSSVRQE